jgi:hypothetical protein
MAKFKVGDKVKSVRTGRKGTLLSMVRGMDVLADRLGALWNVKFDDGAEGMLREGTELTLANSRACNAEPSAQLKKAYDEWKKAEEKFKKWWNPDRRLSERTPAGADGAKKAVEFSDLFFRETGRRPPNGYGNMTLEQMMASNSVRSRNAVVAKAINAQRAARNAAGDFVQYYADSYSYIPKVGEIYKYDGKRVKCTSVQRLQRGSDDRDRYLIEGRVVG